MQAFKPKDLLQQINFPLEVFYSAIGVRHCLKKTFCWSSSVLLLL